MSKNKAYHNAQALKEWIIFMKIKPKRKPKPNNTPFEGMGEYIINK